MRALARHGLDKRIDWYEDRTIHFGRGMMMTADTVNQHGQRPERRARLWNGMFWMTITAFEVLGWFLSHQA